MLKIGGRESPNPNSKHSITIESNSDFPREFAASAKVASSLTRSTACYDVRTLCNARFFETVPRVRTRSNAVTAIRNIVLNDDQWLHASLPEQDEGLEVRSAQMLVPSLPFWLLPHLLSSSNCLSRQHFIDRRFASRKLVGISQLI